MIIAHTEMDVCAAQKLLCDGKGLVLLLLARCAEEQRNRGRSAIGLNGGVAVLRLLLIPTRISFETN